MTRRKSTTTSTAQVLRRVAMHYPQVEEGIACEGTAVESSSFRARGKSFLFVGRDVVRVKLSASQADARQLAAKDPDRYQIGANGWAAVKLADGAAPPLDLLARWIDESYRLIADRRFVALLDERGARAKTEAKRKPSAR